MNQDALRQIVFDALDLSDELRNECADAVVAALTRNAEPVAGSEKVIIINGRKYRKFIPYPEAVEDGTLRCIRCGQIDEPEYHDDALCAASATPPVAPTGAVGISDAISSAMMFECAACTAAGIETNCYPANLTFLVGGKCLCEDCYAESGGDAVAPRISDVLSAALSAPTVEDKP